jgi:hypothetical protein
MKSLGTFPFGMPVEAVTQKDRSIKCVFVLGVYASAVHARWVDPNGKELVKALAVASEPYIFWRGDGIEDIIRLISVPPEVGRLTPADAKLNGPSGVALDDLILHPLGLKREDAWLCDLVPYSCVNDAQQRAIDKVYMPFVKSRSLPTPSTPRLPEKLADDQRRTEITDELKQSGANVIIVLGDQPIRWFLNPLGAKWRRLSDFKDYGGLCVTELGGIKYQILPVAHPRQIAKLGRSSEVWYERHQKWLSKAKITL